MAAFFWVDDWCHLQAVCLGTRDQHRPLRSLALWVAVPNLTGVRIDTRWDGMAEYNQHLRLWSCCCLFVGLSVCKRITHSCPGIFFEIVFYNFGLQHCSNTWLLRTNLIHDFTILTFSVKLAIFHEKHAFTWNSVKSTSFYEFQCIQFHLWRFLDLSVCFYADCHSLCATLMYSK